MNKTIYIVILCSITSLSCGYTTLKESSSKTNEFSTPSIEYFYPKIINVKKVAAGGGGTWEIPFTRIVSATISLELIINYSRSIKSLDSSYGIVYVSPDSSVNKQWFHNTTTRRNPNGTISCSFVIESSHAEGWFEIFLADITEMSKNGYSLDYRMTSNKEKRYVRV